VIQYIYATRESSEYDIHINHQAPTLDRSNKFDLYRDSLQTWLHC
jgi:hypothetical protein